MSLYLFSAALPLYLFRNRGYSLGLVGALVGLASVVQLIATLVAGPLVDRRGARLAMRLGAACYVVAAGLFLTSASLPAIALARVLQGVGIALVLPAVFSVVPALVSQRFQGTALGTVGAFNNVAVAIGPPLGLLLLAGSPASLFLTALATAGLAIATSLLQKVGGRAAEPGGCSSTGRHGRRCTPSPFFPWSTGVWLRHFYRLRFHRARSRMLAGSLPRMRWP